MWVRVEAEITLCNLLVAKWLPGQPRRAGADELFNFVFQTIYLRGAPKAPTVCFRNRCLGNYTIREEPGRETASNQCWYWWDLTLQCSGRGLPNAFGFTSSLVNELSPSSSSDTSTSSSCKPFFGSQVILFSFFSRLRALANQQLT